MSRVGKKPIAVPNKVQVTYKDRLLTAKGPKGELSLNVPESIDCNFDNDTLTFSRSCDDKKVRALHGLTRALANNIVEGVSNGHTKTMQIQGVGFKAEMKGSRLFLSLGFSHPVMVDPPNGVAFATPNANTIQVSGIDKQLVGQMAAIIRNLRKPEPYKGKGIRYENEYVRRKAGKTTAK